MASKRKSTTPCMIPRKTMHLREELEQEPPVLVRQGGGGRQSPLDLGVSSKTESSSAGDHGDDRDGAGTYTCRPCNFETRDLNLFLDHVYSGHPDFRADPSFLCVDCGVSAAKFEGLALHNARVHPSTFSTTLQLRKRDRKVVVVEQHLVTGTDAAGKDAEISITKTPIMRMLKGKFESRRIAVPHAASDEELHSSLSRDAEKKETPAAVTVAHVPTIVHNGATTKVTLPSAIQIVNGSGTLPMLKTAMTQVVSVVQNRTLHQTSPITLSSPSLSSAQSHSHHTSSKNLPKVMIPLSSIPTYSASMDSSSFLKTSFSKFPYPTKAELCYLTVVTKFPEEQIKIWFTAQRLKQGISWSPEEIDEARRKMFNTIIQTAPPSSQHQRQNHHGAHHNHLHHQHAQHTFTVLPAGIPQFLQGSLVSQGGVIVTQPMTMTNGIQVTSAPMALAVTPKPQAAARPMMQARPAAALVADKGVGMVVGTVGSSGSGGINVISSSNSSRSGAGSGASSIISSSSSSSNSNSSSSISSHASVINLSLGYSNHHHSSTNGKVGSVNGKPSGGKASVGDKSNNAGGASAAKDGCEKKNSDINNKTSNTSTTSKSNSESKVHADVKSSADSKPSDSSGNGSKNGSNSGQKSKDVVSGSNKSNTTSTASVPTSTAPRNTPTPPTTTTTTTSNSPGLKIEAASSPAPKSSSPSPAAAAAAAAPSSGGAPSSRTALPNTFLDPSFYKGKKSQEQLAALKDSFVVNQFPNQEEVDRLISMTGLTVREVRKWFSDRRYHFRNLKGSKTTPTAAGEKTPKSGSAAGTTPGSGKGASGSGASETPMDLSDSGSSAGSKTTQQASGGGAAKTPKQDSSAPKTPQQAAASSSAPLSPPPPSQTPTSPSTPSRRPPRPPSPDFTAIRYKEREPHQVRALEASFAQEAEPSGEEVDRLRQETKMTRREIHGWFADKRKRAAAEKKKKEEAERAVREEEDLMMMEVAAGGAGLGAGLEEEKQQRGEDCSSSSGGEPKVNPIKINLKMLKVTEANGKPEGEGSDSPAASSPPPPSSTPKPAPSPSSSSATPPPVPKPSPSPKPPLPAVRGKKTAEQLHLLKCVYARTQWPSAPQYDDMISGTGLARPEVVRWFGDCRYVQKNGTLKWLEEYQDIVNGEDCEKGDVRVLQAHLDANDGTLDESQVVELAQASNLTEELVRHWFSIKAAAAAAALSLDKDTAAAAALSLDKDTADDRTGSDSEAAPPGSDRTEASEAAPLVSSDRTGSEATPPGSSDRTGASEAAPPGSSDRTGASEAAPPGSSDRLGSEAAALLDSDRAGASKAAPLVSNRTGSEEAASEAASDAAPLGSTPESQQGSKGECGSSSSSSSSSSSPPGEEEPQQGEVKEENIEQSVCGGSTEKAQEEKQSDRTVNPTKGTD